jgi:hypothetical protein
MGTSPSGSGSRARISHNAHLAMLTHTGTKPRDCTVCTLVLTDLRTAAVLARSFAANCNNLDLKRCGYVNKRSQRSLIIS